MKCTGQGSDKGVGVTGPKPVVNRDLGETEGSSERLGKTEETGPQSYAIQVPKAN